MFVKKSAFSDKFSQAMMEEIENIKMIIKEKYGELTDEYASLS